MTRITMLTALAAISTFVSTATVLAADPTGEWKYSVSFNGQDFELVMKLKADGEKLTGEIIRPDGQSTEIKNGTFKNDEVSFETMVERNGNTFVTKYKGKVDGDSIKGKTERERDGQVMSRDWEAKREKK